MPRLDVEQFVVHDSIMVTVQLFGLIVPSVD